MAASISLRSRSVAERAHIKKKYFLVGVTNKRVSQASR